ncbi:MAG: tetratricopeptide repeat protein [Thermodesulfobacteriota bacterium]
MDPSDHAEVRRQRVSRVATVLRWMMDDRAKRNVKVFFFLISAFCILGSSCSFPKISILKDSLTPQEHLNLGVAYERQGEFDEAIREYQLAAKKLPLAWLYLGNAYFLKQDWAQAETYFKKAIKEDPQNAAAYNNLAWLYYTKGENLEDAEALAQKALTLDPSKEPIYRDTLDKIKEKQKFIR